jgi:RNA methyltransferase, RsmE family
MVPAQDIDTMAGVVRVTDNAQIKQITRVLRLRIGAELEFLDGHGNVYRCRITRAKRDVVEAEVLEHHAQGVAGQEPQLKVTMILSLLKGTQFKTALAKLTEVGVHNIVPVVATRSVVAGKHDQEDGDDAARMRRWMSIIREATEQCERSVSPYMVNVQAFTEALNELQTLPKDAHRRAFICTERSKAPHLMSYLYNELSAVSVGAPSPAVPPSDIYIIIGPEGGFTAEEIDLALSIGCSPCSLGPTILRAETAAIFAASLVASFGEILYNKEGYQFDTTNHIQ